MVEVLTLIETQFLRNSMKDHHAWRDPVTGYVVLKMHLFGGEDSFIGGPCYVVDLVLGVGEGNFFEVVWRGAGLFRVREVVR